MTDAIESVSYRRLSERIKQLESQKMLPPDAKSRIISALEQIEPDSYDFEPWADKILAALSATSPEAAAECPE